RLETKVATHMSVITSRKAFCPSERCGVMSAQNSGSVAGSGGAGSGGRECLSLVMAVHYRSGMRAKHPSSPAVDVAASEPQEPKAPKPAPMRTRRARKGPVVPDAATVAEIFRRFHAANPEPKGELEYVNPYTLLVAVVLSAQATDAGVNKATRPLFAVVDTPQKMLAFGEERLRDAIKTIGLYRNKAKNVIALSQQLIERFGGEVPRTREELESLPGVGRKTANVVLNIAF